MTLLSAEIELNDSSAPRIPVALSAALARGAVIHEDYTAVRRCPLETLSPRGTIEGGGRLGVVDDLARKLWRDLEFVVSPAQAAAHHLTIDHKEAPLCGGLHRLALLLYVGARSTESDGDRHSSARLFCAGSKYKCGKSRSIVKITRCSATALSTISWSEAFSSPCSTRWTAS